MSAPPGGLFGTGPRGIFGRTLPTVEHQPEQRMVRVIGLGRPTLIGIGTIIGAGIFTLAGTVAHDDLHRLGQIEGDTTEPAAPAAS